MNERVKEVAFKPLCWTAILLTTMSPGAHFLSEESNEKVKRHHGLSVGHQALVLRSSLINRLNVLV
jgi:hypothetical protein